MKGYLRQSTIAAWLILAPFVAAIAAEPRASVDLSKTPVLYEVGYAHLDTQWRWAFPQVIHEFLPDTLGENFLRFEKYPHYRFNFAGAFRYQLMKEYFPAAFEELRMWAARDRWIPSGGSWEENDVLLPSSESLIRQLLYGQRFFEKEFGQQSQVYLLPDCFGFPASLPSVLAHCGIRGFATQKLTWGSAIGIPFNVGVWEGLDGESVIAALNCGKYDARLEQNVSLSQTWLKRLQANGAKSGVFADFQFYGTGDRGGAPDEASLEWLEKSVASTGPVRVISARADQMFRDITDAQRRGLPKYRGDLLLTEHSAGTLTSQAYIKRWNRMNETLAEAAEKASVAAHIIGAAPYPREKLRQAWQLVLGAQFHDILSGTCLPRAYTYSWNDEVIALNCFASVLQDAVGGVARALDTRVDGLPVVVFNPLSIEREDVVEATLELPAGMTNPTICNAAGVPVPTQVLSREGSICRLLFLAKVPAIGFAVYAARNCPASNGEAPLLVSERSLENARYRVQLDDAGDIASIYDKAASRELLAAPARLVFLNEQPATYPAWNMDWKDRKEPPRGCVQGPATFRVTEKGPVRVSLEVERQAENSVFVQDIRLAAGSAGERLEVANRILWLSTGCCLKAEFPLTVSNSLATYNWDLGKIQRGNNNPKKFESPTHQWFDLTDNAGDYGVSVLTDAKYGSDKPTDGCVRLTLLYSPGVRDSYVEQKYQDWGRHEFTYGLSGHAGDWRSGKTDWQAARLNQPLFAFSTSAHPGKLGAVFSLLQTSSDQVAVRAVKLAEDTGQVIIRLQELNGSAARGVSLSATAGLDSAAEVNGLERAPRSLKSPRHALLLDFKPYQLRSIACTLRPPVKLAPPASSPLTLPYNMDVFTFHDAKQDGSCDDSAVTLPAEMIADSVVSEGISFRIGPRENGRLNALSCLGQKLMLPAGNFNRLYLLATAVQGDTNGTFLVDGQPTTLTFQDWSSSLGSWDEPVFTGRVDALSYSIRNPLERISAGHIKRDPLAWFCSHRHHRDGSDEAYTYCYLYKYRLDLPAGAKTLTLPFSPHIRLLAASAARNENDDVRALEPLYDEFSGRTPITRLPNQSK